MCLEPVGTMPDTYLEGHTQVGIDGLHDLTYEGGHLVELGEGDIEVQFVMHLQDHPTAKASLPDGLLEANPRSLDEVSSGAL